MSFIWLIWEMMKLILAALIAVGIIGSVIGLFYMLVEMVADQWGDE